MSKSLKLVVLIVCSLFLAIFFSPTLTFAADAESGNIIETTFWGNLKDDGSGCGVYTILNMIVDILSFGVGVLAAIGITIVGVKYLTAGGNEEQTRMARHRMSQIVIGIVVYVLLYVGVQWLLPGGKLNSGQKCTVVSNDELAQIKAKEKAEKEE